MGDSSGGDPGYSPVCHTERSSLGRLSSESCSSVVIFYLRGQVYQGSGSGLLSIKATITLYNRTRLSCERWTWGRGEEVA